MIRKLVARLFGLYTEQVAFSPIPAGVALRRCGRTTRLVDKYVQLFFQEGIIDIVDHHRTLRSNVRLADLISSRLLTEHKIRIDRVNGKHYVRLTMQL